MRARIAGFALSLALVLGPVAVTAQTPAPAFTPPASASVWDVSFGAGLALTRGNSDTTNVNLSFDATYDPRSAVVVKTEGSYLRSAAGGEATANRLALLGRGEHALTDRAYVFGQVQFLRDPFKDIDSLTAPTAGIGYKIVDTSAVSFAVETSGGAVWEKHPDVNVDTSGAVTAGEKFSCKVSDTATITESGRALWKTGDFGDALYIVSAGLQTVVTPGVQLKVELLDTYKAKPRLTTIDSNDVALMAVIVVKFKR